MLRSNDVACKNKDFLHNPQFTKCINYEQAYQTSEYAIEITSTIRNVFMITAHYFCYYNV